MYTPGPVLSGIYGLSHFSQFGSNVSTYKSDSVVCSDPVCV